MSYKLISFTKKGFIPISLKTPDKDDPLIGWIDEQLKTTKNENDLLRLNLLRDNLKEIPEPLTILDSINLAKYYNTQYESMFFKVIYEIKNKNTDGFHFVTKRYFFDPKGKNSLNQASCIDADPKALALLMDNRVNVEKFPHTEKGLIDFVYSKFNIQNHEEMKVYLSNLYRLLEKQYGKTAEGTVDANALRKAFPHDATDSMNLLNQSIFRKFLGLREIAVSSFSWGHFHALAKLREKAFEVAELHYPSVPATKGSTSNDVFCIKTDYPYSLSTIPIADGSFRGITFTDPGIKLKDSKKHEKYCHKLLVAYYAQAIANKLSDDFPPHESPGKFFHLNLMVLSHNLARYVLFEPGLSEADLVKLIDGMLGKSLLNTNTYTSLTRLLMSIKTTPRENLLDSLGVYPQAEYREIRILQEGLLPIFISYDLLKEWGLLYKEPDEAWEEIKNMQWFQSMLEKGLPYQATKWDEPLFKIFRNMTEEPRLPD